MRKDDMKWWYSFVLVILLFSWSVLLAGQKRTVVHPKDTGVGLENPGMGWGFHYYSNIPTNYGSKL
ncbi:MAG: hypothetical protein WBC22_17300, partial [Sedimentisphaerales bacterium]